MARELARVYARHGSTFVAAAVLGRPDVAAEGKLSVLVSGDTRAKARVMPLLAQIGTRMFDLGEQIEGAMVAKLAANFLMGVNHEAQGQAAALVEAGGLDRGRFLRCWSNRVSLAGAVFAGYGQMIGARDFSQLFSRWGMDSKICARRGSSRRRTTCRSRMWMLPSPICRQPSMRGVERKIGPS